MDDNILQSVIELTRQHDIDSLEVTLMTTLADIIPANAVFLVKPSDQSITMDFIETMRLCIPADTKCKQKYEWFHDNNNRIDSTVLQELFHNRKPAHHKLENKQSRFLFPIIHNNRTVAALGIDTGRDLTAWHPIIEAFVKIYSNYLAILHISERDKLTDLHNRRTFDYKLEKLLKNQRRQYEFYGHAVEPGEKRRTYKDAHSWLAMVDIDHFKNINDTYGHLFGDEVILILSQQMKKFFRGSDLLFRFGGEEFVIILTPLLRDNAHRILERFRLSIFNHKIPQVGNITISVGFAKIIDSISSHFTLDHADKALYYAKEHGRNCVHNYEKLAEQGFLSENNKSSVTLFIDDMPDAN